MDLVARNKNKDKNKNKVTDSSVTSEQDDDLEAAGAEGSKTPILECGDDDMDPGLLDLLHRSPKLKPNQGYAESWD